MCISSLLYFLHREKWLYSIIVLYFFKKDSRRSAGPSSLMAQTNLIDLKATRAALIWLRRDPQYLTKHGPAASRTLLIQRSIAMPTFSGISLTRAFGSGQISVKGL